MLVPLLVVATGTAGLAVAVGVPSAAGADPLGSCTTTSGVIVAVDFAPWGGNIERGCDATLTTGYDALYAAGFTTAGDEHDGPEFICRIDDDPPPSEDPCINTPPATAYWSYWHADAGQDTWTYSTLGAANYQPLPGSVDAWTFGSTDLGGTDGQPTFPPSAVRATNTTATITTAPPTTVSTPTTPPTASTPTAGRGRRAKAGAAGRSRLPYTAPSTSQPVPTTAPAPTTTAPPSTTTSAPSVASAGSRPTPSTPQVVDAAPASLDRQSSGSPVALIVGGVLVAALAAVAAVVARRRRRAG